MATNNKISVPVSILAVWLTALIALGVDHSRRLRTVEADIACIRTRLDYLTPAVVLPDFSDPLGYQSILTGEKKQKKHLDLGESPDYFGLEVIFEQGCDNYLLQKELSRF